MAEFTVWFKPFTAQNERLLRVLDALEQAGVELQAVHLGDTPQGAGIIFLDHQAPLEDIQETLEAYTLYADTKIIAVAVSLLPTSSTWALLRSGVVEVFSWFEVEKPVQIILSRLRYWHTLEEKVAYLQQRMVGSSRCWLNTLRQVVDMALSNCQVLIMGESGTGKELVAQEIHQLDTRPDKRDCVVVDCTNLIPGLSGSELFGHEKGAFTNAISTRDGALALAHEGTLFLDELGELPLPLQAELLRALQEGTYKRVGSNTWRKASFRLVSATNRDLLAEVHKGTFRQDLYYRVSGWTCQLPPLRERKEDIVVLAEHFFRQQHHIHQPVDRQVYDFLLLRDYPGNVRELQQLINRIANKHLGEGPITIGDIPRSDWPDFARLGPTLQGSDLEAGVKGLLYQGLGLKEIKDQVTEIAKKVAITHENGNLKLAAHRLGCSERILQMHRRGEPEAAGAAGVEIPRQSLFNA
ncbi:sigma 54-interacting transcriptional regulator [Hymenobacter metallicola]|uniref:Sigma-54-dependent Fis family transcriptional regulator n=1 Tax=Hymenobacter metallicola TaxID=2563114 RepID=A0A4Z0QHT6_9BACT|nr:sigma 54-interacting transcriptional regulator [Hymenobacter metallicola]TGE28813.1 sigma-54-dependent Fis family transcriptional regulator [Hymenobacter metallicola]